MSAVTEWREQEAPRRTGRGQEAERRVKLRSHTFLNNREIQGPAPQAVTTPGAERVDDRTQRWTGNDFWQLVHLAQRGVQDAPPPR